MVSSNFLQHIFNTQKYPFEIRYYCFYLKVITGLRKPIQLIPIIKYILWCVVILSVPVNVKHRSYCSPMSIAVNVAYLLSSPIQSFVVNCQLFSLYSLCGGLLLPLYIVSLYTFQKFIK